MNLLEARMVELLRELKRNYAVVGIKAEFEAEGTRTEELMRLKEICLRAEASLTLKIGGCEAIRDMFDARAVGVNHLVAPMVETPFALRKYLRAIDVAFPAAEQRDVEFLVNIETIQAVEKFDDMIRIPEIKKLNGIVLGRSDLTGSMGIAKELINSKQVLNIVKSVLIKAKTLKMTTVVGGTIAVESIPFLIQLSGGLLDRFETRKVCFACSEALNKNPAEGIRKALTFEMMWLQNKRNHYEMISKEDEKRLAALERRFA